MEYDNDMSFVASGQRSIYYPIVQYNPFILVDAPVEPPLSTELYPSIQPLNSTSENNYSSNNFTYSYNRCGVPGICDFSAITFCLNITVAECQACNSTASGFFLFIILCLGLAIILGNFLVILLLVQLRKKRTPKPTDLYKASLALADVITGECKKAILR